VRQVIHRLSDGRVEVLDVPAPALRPEGVLVDVRASLVSTGTERATLAAGRRSLLGKARSRPDQVRRVVEKARRDGVGAAREAVRFRLREASPLGYSAAGVVLAAGERVRDLAPGDRVACGGAGWANHAEVDFVPGNLAVPVPESVSFDDAAFATVGAIALHAVRQADAAIGARVAVVGLGLIGRLAAQILRAGGCRVAGVDVNENAVAAALAAGDVHDGFPRQELGETLPAGISGFDAVLVTAATESGDPVRLAGRLARDRGRVVVVGDVDVELPRDEWYGKELELRVSRSYGPGRYDPEYESRGLDYPIGYVRWTERRNMAAFLDLVAAGSLRLDPLVAERVPVEQAPAAFDALVRPGGPTGAVLIRYEPSPAPVAPVPAVRRGPARSPLAAGVVGAGSFVASVLAPGLRKAGFTLEAIASAGGLSAASARGRLGFARALALDDLLADDAVGLVAVASRHDSHAELAARALEAGKAVFVEKPPALTEDELELLAATRAASGRPLLVGFNRRHAPLVRALAEVLPAGAPVQLLLRVSAPLEEGHWLDDPAVGGGRLLGEGCHFVDLACALAGRPPERVLCTMRAPAGEPLAAARAFTVVLDFADGSSATVVYGADGAVRLPKEYVEAHAGGVSAVLDDFRRLSVVGAGRRRRARRGRRDKGHAAQFAELRRLVEGGEPEGLDSLATMAVTLAALRSAETGEAVRPVAPGA
jgi:predicted dehydrogenase/threonine dehydrogenase-like Zn-dependent dehydrogenase